jgi:hypothetical protein
MVVNFVVTFNYDPGTPTKYFVSGVSNSREARQAALLDNGYNPGVDILVREAKPEESASTTDSVTYRSLTADEVEMIRYND